MDNENILRQQMADAMAELERRGLNCGMSGNLSARYGDALMVTPSATAPAMMMPDDMVMLDFNGVPMTDEATKKPTSEWHMHRDILIARPEVGAVVHTHSPFATALACLGKDIPAFHYMIAIVGGDSIRCAPYALFGTPALSDGAVKALNKRDACLLANHGLVVVGTDLPATVSLTREVETLCEQYWRALQVGEPNLLTREQMRDVLARFKDYRSPI